MLKKLKIENFRCFKSFELDHLGRVNLLVGKNNSGKTSVLEAIKLFYSESDDISSLEEIMSERGEYLQDGETLDISHLFYGHEFSSKKYISITSDKDYKFTLKFKDDELKTDLENSSHQDKLTRLTETKHDEYTDFSSFMYAIKNATTTKKINKFSTTLDFWGPPFSNLEITNNVDFLKTKFISISSLTVYETLELFNQIVLTSEEDLVYQALQIIEPNIERIAPIGNEIKNNNSRSGFFVRLSDTQKRIPIGSMGDGIWRILGLTLSLVSAKDGVLLVDEIDTGLHYTALENMWRLIWETSKKLNIQVFATTHNSDCWKALEALTNREDVREEDISIQRIEKDTPRSVAYNKEEIATAVEREIEVR
ncbi:MAG: hypothetical protein RLZZ04_357 [Cyanobacteriota bacterium]|jgi:AAA15 family ATPase/GTPase